MGRFPRARSLSSAVIGDGRDGLVEEKFSVRMAWFTLLDPLRNQSRLPKTSRRGDEGQPAPERLLKQEVIIELRHKAGSWHVRGRLSRDMKFRLQQPRAHTADYISHITPLKKRGLLLCFSNLLLVNTRR